MNTSDILATIAIFVSIFTFIINLYFENKRLKRESDAKFFQDIYSFFMLLLYLKLNVQTF